MMMIELVLTFVWKTYEKSENITFTINFELILSRARSR